MMSISNAAEALAEVFDLPEEAVPGAARVTVTSGKRVAVENHRGLLSYGEERIVIRLPRGKLTLSGAGLQLILMSAERLFIGGRIQALEWD